MPLMPFYPKARGQRPSIHHPSVRPRRLGLLKAASINFLLIQILFLCLFCYIFGALFQEETHIHNINILFVDYDGGAIGEAVRSAYWKLRGAGFPSLIERSTSLYPQPNFINEAVCDIEYWGALTIAFNASDHLAAAFRGGSAATSYNKSDVLTMVWNEARYPTVVDSVLADALKSLSEAARVAYAATHGKQALQSVNSSDPAALAALYDPWSLASVNFQPTPQGSRMIYNTMVFILIMIQEFFYLGYVNALYVQFKLYTSVAPHRIAIVRQIISALYTLIGSLCTTGAIWAFRDAWQVNGNQFVLSWMVLWLFAHLNFLILDSFTVWLAPPYVPWALISWVVLNATSLLLPFELSPRFYRWGYALPAHSAFQVLIDIWSGGCNRQLDSSLPVLFAFELIGIAVSTVGVYRRAHYACLHVEQEERSCEQRIVSTFVEQREAYLARQEPIQMSQEIGTAEAGRFNDGEKDEFIDQALVNIIRREVFRSNDERQYASQGTTGPSLALPFTH